MSSGEVAPAGGRAYGGVDGAARKAARHQRVLDAAYDIFGQREGWTQATVERICSQAGVATRTVYEEFGSREHLLLAVYEKVILDVMAQVNAALDRAGSDLRTRVNLAIEAYVGHITEDPRRARIAHLSMRRAGEWAHSARLKTISQLIERVQQTLATMPTTPISKEWGELAAVAMAGAVNEVIVYWAEAEDPPSPQAVVDLITLWFDTFLAIIPRAESG